MGTNVTGGSAGAGHVMGSTPMPSTDGRLNIGDIMRRFDLETAGDAWILVMENDWPCERPVPGNESSGPWLIEVPEDFTL